MILKIMYAPLLCKISCFLHNAVKFQGVGGDYGGGVVWEAGSNHTLIELYKLSSFFVYSQQLVIWVDSLLECQPCQISKMELFAKMFNGC